jgi:glycosyltransferase involved in cell wall biosynthesis
MARLPMKISVITVCYNAAPVIEGCLRSVAEQTHSDIEHIVIDGRSMDRTVDIVGRFPHVAALVSEPDRGIYDAMNKGLDRVTGDYVLFLNADDRFASRTALAGAVAAIERDPGGDVYYGWLEVRPEGGVPQVFRPPKPAGAATLMICGCLPHQSTLARSAVFARTGRFDLRYRYHADYDWFLKVLADPMIELRSIDEVIGSFQLGGASSRLADGQPEVHVIQDQSALYASPEWDRRRIKALQEALLQERIETARLRDEMQSLRLGGRKVSWRRAWRHETLRAACIHYIPPAMLDILRRVRRRWLGALTSSGRTLGIRPTPPVSPAQPRGPPPGSP